MPFPMTFEQFQATRRKVDDVGKAAGVDLGDKQSGFVYESGLHIFDMPDGRYLLVICNDQRVSADLEELERDLFAFGSDEENFN